MYIGLRNRKSGQGPTKDCRAIDSNFRMMMERPASLCDDDATVKMFWAYYMLFSSRDSSVGIASGYGLDYQGEREFESR
jgi:hypothetical protein